MKEVLGRLGAFLLIGLLLIKTSAFHIYEHHDVLESADNPCEICVLTLESQQFEGIVPSFLAFDCVIQPIPSQSEIVFYGQNFIDSFQDGIHFSRPPPYTSI